MKKELTSTLNLGQMWHKEIKTIPSTVYLLQLQFSLRENTDISFIVSKLLSCWLTQTTSEGPDDTGCVTVLLSLAVM